MGEAPAEWVTTTSLLHALRDERDRHAWSRLVERFREPLGAFARKSGVPPSDVDDLVQEALLEFMSCYRDGRYDRERGRLSAWLFGIARHCVLRRRQEGARRGTRVTPGDAGVLFGVVDEKNLEDVWNTEWERWAWERCLERAREEFEPATFRAFALVARGDVDAPGAAAALGIPVKAVYNAKHRVLKRLRDLRGELEGDA